MRLKENIRESKSIVQLAALSNEPAPVSWTPTYHEAGLVCKCMPRYSIGLKNPGFPRRQWSLVAVTQAIRYLQLSGGCQVNWYTAQVLTMAGIAAL